ASAADQHLAAEPVHVRWRRRRRCCCHARVSLLVYEEIRERDDPEETSSWSLRPPFIHRLYPAETRLKEGADARDSDRTGGNHSLAAGRWRPVSALQLVSSGDHFDVNAARTRMYLFSVFREVSWIVFLGPTNSNELVVDE